MTISYQEALAALTAPGQRFEVVEAEVDGRTLVTFRNADRERVERAAESCERLGIRLVGVRLGDGPRPDGVGRRSVGRVGRPGPHPGRAAWSCRCST